MQDIDEANKLKVDVIEYRGWKNTLRLCNDTVQMTILTEVGPRITSFGFLGEQNEFYENLEDDGQSGGGYYRVYGGHRLWVSPEVDRTYFPDNVPVSVRRNKDAFIFTAPPESTHPGTGLQKEIEVRLDEMGAHVSVTHRIRNVGAQATELSPWALSVMAGGGRAILPLSPRAPASKDTWLPESVFALWSYTDLADSRWKLGTKYIQLQQEDNPVGRFKSQMGGIYNPSGWGAYFRQGHLFVKRAEVHKGSTYPDFGCNFELWTDSCSLELETLGPLQNLEPGQTAEHKEEWWLFRDISTGEDDSWIDSVILKAVETTGSVVPER